MPVDFEQKMSFFSMSWVPPQQFGSPIEPALAVELVSELIVPTAIWKAVPSGLESKLNVEPVPVLTVCSERIASAAKVAPPVGFVVEQARRICLTGSVLLLVLIEPLWMRVLFVNACQPVCFLLGCCDPRRARSAVIP